MNQTAHKLIQEFHGERKWGRILETVADANTIRWLARNRLEVTSVPLRAMEDGSTVPGRTFVEGRWRDPDLLAGETFDSILAVHALESYAMVDPEFAPLLLGRLRSHLSGVLYLVGMEFARETEEEVQLLMQLLNRFTLAARVVAGRRLYQPPLTLDEAVDQLEFAGYRVLKKGFVPAFVDEAFVHSSIDKYGELLEECDPDSADILRQIQEDFWALYPNPPESKRCSGIIYVIQAEAL